MTGEELFLAIGEVEESRLMRTEKAIRVSSLTSDQEDIKMRNGKINTGRLLRNLIAAVVILSMLAVTAYAVVGYVIFDSPEDMITAIFGDKTGYDHKDITYWTDPWKPEYQYTNPAFDRVPADESVVSEDVAPHVSSVGQSISWRGYTLTVDALMYDSITKCGILTCKLENPEGIKPYHVEATGEIWNHPVSFNQYGYAHIIQEKTTDTCLAMTYYFQYDPDRNRDMEVTISQWTFVEPGAEYQAHIMELFDEIKQEYTWEDAISAYIAEYGQEEYERVKAESTEEEILNAGYAVLWNWRLEELYTCPHWITISPDRESTLKNISLGGGTVSVSPISFRIDMETLEFLYRVDDFTGALWIDSGNIDSVVICYEDGTEYIVTDEAVKNAIFLVADYPEGDVQEQVQTDYGYVMQHSKHCSVLTIMFNRIIDVDNVTAVRINGVELSLD